MDTARDFTKRIRKEIDPEWENCLRKKLIENRVISKESDLKHIDSIIESAYDSDKQALWAENHRGTPRYIQRASTMGSQRRTESKSHKVTHDSLMTDTFEESLASGA